MSAQNPQSVQHLYETTSRLLRRGALSNIRNLFIKLHPSESAQLIKQFHHESQDQIIALLFNHQVMADIFCELGSSFLGEYLERHQNYTEVVSVLQKLASDDKADLIGELSKEMSKELLSRMEKEDFQEVKGLLQYSEESAGGLMSTEVFKLNQETTVKEAISSLQEMTDAVTVFYIYVINDNENIVGVLSIRQLFQVKPDKKLCEIMLRDVVTVNVHEDQEEVARLVAQYDLVAIPVIGTDQKLVGVITVDDVIDVIHEEAAENVLKIGSADIESLDEFEFTKSLMARLPWFLIIILSGVIAWEVIAYYLDKLPQVGVFAGFIPMLLRHAGIVARQTSVIMVQGLTPSHILPSQAVKIFLQQLQLTLITGLITSCVIGTYSYFRFPSAPSLPFIIGLALLSSMFIAMVLGFFVPILFKKIKLDPALASGTSLNFFLDVLGLLIYFNILNFMHSHF